MFLGIVAIFLCYKPAFAVSFEDNGQSSEYPNLAYLYLLEKNSMDWNTPIEDPSWGKMEYNLSGSTFDYVFNGHKLMKGDMYELIYYPDPWPGNGLICLGEGTVNKGGNIHIEGSVDTGDLPSILDWNHPENPNDSLTDRNGGAKIWLVLASDIDCTSKVMLGWNPDNYLFEFDVINFDDVDNDLVKLENKDLSWNVINDGTYGLFYYDNSDSTFKYTFSGYGLQNTTNYSLIYYADGWPGNHPGALIGAGLSDGTGNLLLTGNPDLGMNLPTMPDANYPNGAKIWLVPSSMYDETTNAVTSWSPASFLWETDWVHYTDTDL